MKLPELDQKFLRKIPTYALKLAEIIELIVDLKILNLTRNIRSVNNFANQIE